MTVAMDTYTKRGIGADIEYRYSLGRETYGQLFAFGINESFADSRTTQGLPENRGFFKFQHIWQATPSLSFKVDSNVTSDDNIYKTYAFTTADRVKQRAETNAFVTQRWDAGHPRRARLLVPGPDPDPRRSSSSGLPRSSLTSLRQPLPGVPGLLYEGQASFVNFIRDVGSSGIRADFHPRLYMPFSVGGLFTMTPYGGGRLTFYNQEAIGQQISLGPALGQRAGPDRADQEHRPAPAAGGGRRARRDAGCARVQP